MNKYIEEARILATLEEARTLNKRRALIRQGYDPIPIVTRAYYTDALISIDAFQIADLLQEKTPYKRWVENQTSLQGEKLVRCYEKRWLVGLVGLEATPVYLGSYMPESEAGKLVDKYNAYLRGEINAC